MEYFLMALSKTLNNLLKQFMRIFIYTINLIYYVLIKQLKMISQINLVFLRLILKDKKISTIFVQAQRMQSYIGKM